MFFFVFLQNCIFLMAFIFKSSPFASVNKIYYMHICIYEYANLCVCVNAFVCVRQAHHRYFSITFDPDKIMNRILNFSF